MGAGICEHKKLRRYCKICGGAGLCPHGQYKYSCKECRGSQVCEHGKDKHKCRLCHPELKKPECEHGKDARKCKDCSPQMFCEHDQLSRLCRQCHPDLPARGRPKKDENELKQPRRRSNEGDRIDETPRKRGRPAGSTNKKRYYKPILAQEFDQIPLPHHFDETDIGGDGDETESEPELESRSRGGIKNPRKAPAKRGLRKAANSSTEAAVGQILADMSQTVAGSGMSSTPGKRTRGRPPKNSQPAAQESETGAPQAEEGGTGGTGAPTQEEGSSGGGQRVLVVVATTIAQEAQAQAEGQEPESSDPPAETQQDSGDRAQGEQAAPQAASASAVESANVSQMQGHEVATPQSPWTPAPFTPSGLQE